MTEQTSILLETLTNKGHRITQSRRVIIEILVNSGGHITADDLAEKVRSLHPDIGRMTVYRTLDLLSDLGALHRIYQGTGAAHFIIMTSGSHHHLICSNCQTVIEFDNCMADEITASLSTKFNFQINSHLFEIHGLCQDCQ
jgi:Fur family ferric uptake transcriptional regulator